MHDVNELETLRQRIAHLEEVERAYRQVEQLVNYAAANRDLNEYAGSAVLYVDQHSGRIMDANSQALCLLGYDRETLCALTIQALEILDEATASNRITYMLNTSEEQLYPCQYRHRDGYSVPVQVYCRLLGDAPDASVLHYTLEEQSLSRRLWHELTRREDADFDFREKLKQLNEINLQLANMPTLDKMCRQAILLGLARLGFDRLSIWFADRTTEMMIGTYGVDEAGQVRDEREARWSYRDTYVIEFINGRREQFIISEKAPIYNDRSEIIGYGWHVSVPLISAGQFIGFMSADNFLNRRPLKDYEPELLRLYGVTVGHLAALQQAKQQELALQLERERVHMLEAFIRDIGHEFRTPLSAITLKSYLMERMDDAARRAQIAGDIQAQVQAISAMLDDIIYIVRMETDVSFDLKRIAIDVSALVQDIAQRLAAAISKPLHWQVRLDEAPPLLVDPHRLTRAIEELIKNAIEFTPEGGTITVSTHHDAEHQFSIRVQDTGIGIAASELGKIFSRLYRVDQARTTRGVGLGLPIAKVIVEAHGGQIVVESTLGAGSIFTIQLPVVHADQDGRRTAGWQ